MARGTLTIDLDAICANWRALDQRSDTAVQTGAVVKADGYGLGAGRVGRALAAAGARRFFVATVEEGAGLRQGIGPDPEIFVFAGHMAGDTDTISDLGLVPVLNSIAQLTRHFESLSSAAFGIQLDTGMNRLGMEPGEWTAVARTALEAGPDLIISHLACADTPDHPMNARQLATFRAMTDDTAVPRSLAATAGILLGEEYHFDLTRPGVGLYGGLPFTEARTVVTLNLPVIQVREVETGETVGYANAWTAPAPARIATVAAGYADGLIRAMGASARVFADGLACPLVGRVSMDLLTVDVSDLERVPDTVEILGPSQGVDVLAEAAGTIGYEVLTALGARYDRRYVGRVQ